MSEPVWERLRAPDHEPLRIGPIRRATCDELCVRDGALPDHGGAVVFDAWLDGSDAIVRAAAIRGHEVAPVELRATHLRIEASDGRLEALLTGSGPVATAGELERQACACRGISVDAAYRTIGAEWETVDAVKRATRIGFGPCQGRRCVPWLARVLELDADDPQAQITPRPPLVPVPISLLAAFAERTGGAPARPDSDQSAAARRRSPRI